MNLDSDANNEKMQIVISQIQVTLPSFPMGKALEPELWDYVDGVVVIVFLLGLLAL